MSSEDPREREDLCGLELVPEDHSGELDEEYDQDTWYEARDGGHYCCREVWDGAESDRCIWHADVADKPPDQLVALLSERPARLDRAVLREIEFPDNVDFTVCRLWAADLRGANLRYADFRDADLEYADLRGANLQSADLSDADLWEADLRNAILRFANFSDAFFGDADLSGSILGAATLSDADLGQAVFAGGNLEGANLTGAYLREADLSDANVENAVINNATLEGTDLTACKLHQTSFEDATFDEATTFGTTSGYEKEADRTAEDVIQLPTHLSGHFRALGRPFTDPDSLENAETQYRTIQRLKREHDLKQDPALEIQEKHARRKRALAERRYWDWFKLAFYRWPMGYGEKPTHVVGTSIAVILAAMLAYPHAGGFDRTTGATTPVADLSQALAVPEAVTSAVGPWLTSFYFSVVTFTTVGYGDLQPATEMGRLLASVESFLGALLMALLVFVLGRRATW